MYKAGQIIFSTWFSSNGIMRLDGNSYETDADILILCSQQYNKNPKSALFSVCLTFHDEIILPCIKLDK